jgi:sugar lactone lactonase YvrE
MATHRERSRTLGVAAVAAAVSFAGCGGGSSTASGEHPAADKQPVSSASPRPLPYTVEATYRAVSLGLEHPQSLAVGPDGNVYVTDSAQHVTVVSPSGHVLRRWGRLGSGPGEFHFVSADASDPTAVHASLTVGDDGSVYVSDSGNHRVEVFSAQGKYLRQFGRFGSDTAEFLDPFDVATDRQGDVYVADDKLETLSMWSPGGAFRWRIGGVHTSDPDLMGHFHLSSVDRHGRLVAVIDDVARIVLLDRSGHKIDAFGSQQQLPDNACDVGVDLEGNIYTADCSAGGGAVFNSGHHLVKKWSATAALSLLTAPRFLSTAAAFALTTDGSIAKLRVTAAGA